MDTGSGAEEGCHEIEGVELPLEVERGTILPVVPDGVQCLNIFPDPRPRRYPRHGESALDVPLHLSSQAKPEAAPREILEVAG